MERVFVQPIWLPMETTAFVIVLLCLLEVFVNVLQPSYNLVQHVFAHPKQLFIIMSATLATYNTVLYANKMEFVPHACLHLLRRQVETNVLALIIHLRLQIQLAHALLPQLYTITIVIVVPHNIVLNVRQIMYAQHAVHHL